MIMRMPKPGKAEIIMMFLNQWDPAHGAHKDYRFHRVEAEEIAQKIRKNSRQETVEKAVRESIEFRMELEKQVNHSMKRLAKCIPNGSCRRSKRLNDECEK